MPQDARIALAVVAAAGVNVAVLARLMDLHHRGYLTHAELEREYGIAYDLLADIAGLPLSFAA
jgi:hypothetical protein